MLAENTHEIAVSSNPPWMSHEYSPNLVSVIIPTYNRAWILKEALESVTGQTYRPVQIIIVDDGSSDCTEELVHRWKATLTPNEIELKYVRTPHRGASAARNTGCALSSGEFIQYLDSDDLLHPKKFALQVAALRLFPRTSLAASHFVRTTEFKVFWPNETNRPPRERSFWDEPTLFVWPALFRRTFILQNGPWDESLVRWQDVEYLLRAGRFLDMRAAFVDQSLCAYRIHSRQRISEAKRTESALIARLAALEKVELSTSFEQLHVKKNLKLLYQREYLIGLRYASRKKIDFMAAQIAKLTQDRLERSLIRSVDFCRPFLGKRFTAHLFKLSIGMFD